MNPSGSTYTSHKRPARPHSASETFAKLDGRTRAGKLLRDIRMELSAHVGGSPSATQRILIDQAAQLRLRLALMDSEDPTGTLSERNGRQYLAWANALSRLLGKLGMERGAAPKRTVDDIMSRKSLPPRSAAA